MGPLENSVEGVASSHCPHEKGNSSRRASKPMDAANEGLNVGPEAPTQKGQALRAVYRPKPSGGVVGGREYKKANPFAVKKKKKQREKSYGSAEGDAWNSKTNNSDKVLGYQRRRLGVAARGRPGHRRLPAGKGNW